MAALAAVVALLYRRFIGGMSSATNAMWIAGLAAVLYAIDDSHGFAVGWLANRCGIQGAFFAVLALLAHHRCDSLSPRLGPAALLIALLCSEQMVAAGGFLFAYALFLS